MRGFVLYRRKNGPGTAVNAVNTELIRSRRPGTGRFVRLGQVYFNRIESVGMVIKRESIAQAKFIPSGGDLAKLRNDVPNIVLQILFTTYCSFAESFPKAL